MATYNTELSQTYSVRRATGGSREPVIASVSVACTTAMIDNTNDVINLLYVPKGAVIISAVVSATDMDTGAAALAFNIGDASSNGRIFAATTVGQAGTLSTAMAAGAHLYKFTADTLISAFVSTVAATAAAGTLNFSIMYFVDPEYSTTALVAA